MSVRLSPVLAGLGTYPFVRLERGPRAAARRGRGASSTSAWASRARRRPRSSARRWRARSRRWRPTRARSGCPSCARRSRAGPARRFGATLDPDTEVIPTLGSKEAVFALAQRLRRRRSWRCRTPAYPVYERGAPFAGKRVLELPLREENGWLPDLDARRLVAASACCGSTTRTTRRARARRCRVLRARRRAGARARLRARLRRGVLGALLRGRAAASARCRSPTARTSPCSTRCPSARRCRATASGFVAGDPEIVAALKKYRPNVGVAPLEFVQRAAIAAWSDEAHVDEVRERYRAKREALLPALEAVGLRERGRRRDVLPLDGRRPGRRRARRALARGGRGRRARARSSARPATCGSRSSRRPRPARAPPRSSGALAELFRDRDGVALVDELEDRAGAGIVSRSRAAPR